MSRVEEHPASTRPTYSPEIAGIRAVAVALVVLYHARVPGLSGGYVGVDVFFVLSGFLMTRLIASGVDDAGRFDYRGFYFRRVRRLLPASGLVLVATMVAAKLALPPLAVAPIAQDGVAAALYVVNMWLAASGTNYLATDAPSPLQHYWSLALEEQFYLFWPAVVVLARRRRRLGLVMIAIVAASLVLCVVVTGIAQPWAFFPLPTRAWELGAGALVAVGLDRGRIVPGRWIAAGGWAGLAAILASAVVFDDATVFPGAAAVLPVAGTVAVLASVGACPSAGVGALLRPRLMQRVGAWSYSTYLWHWPLLVLPAAALGPLGWPARLGAVVLSVALGWATYRFVEDPIRRGRLVGRSNRRSLALLAAVTAAGVIASTAVSVPPRLSTDRTVPALTALAPGTVAGAPPTVPLDVTPALADVSDDLPITYADGCQSTYPSTAPDLDRCVYGDRGGDRTVLLVGDSHAAQWFPALQVVAAQRHWRLVNATKPGCPVIEAPVRSLALGRTYTECARWRASLVAQARRLRPDMVVVGEYVGMYQGLLGDRDRQDFVARWERAQSAFFAELPTGARTVFLEDTPSWAGAPTVCLSGSLTDVARCGGDPAVLFDRDLQVAARATAARSGVDYVPVQPWLCRARCEAMAGNVVVYRDRNHITATMSRLLGPSLSAALGAPGS